MDHRSHLILPIFIAIVSLANSGFSFTSNPVQETIRQEAEVWTAPARKARVKNPIPANATSVASGKQLFNSGCVSCHGDSGAGDGPAAPFLNVRPTDLGAPSISKQTDGSIFWKISTGRTPMPTFEAIFTLEQRWQLVNFIRTLSVKGPVPQPGHLLDAVVEDYLLVGKSLALDNPKSVIKELEALTLSLNNLNLVSSEKWASELVKKWTKSKVDIQSAGKVLGQSKSLEELRVSFHQLTLKMIPGLKAFGYGGKEKIRVFDCDSAFKGKGASWLQISEIASNPYLGKAKATCGKESQKIGKIPPPVPAEKPTPKGTKASLMEN
ncbi:MAG: DUF3347 domain-containing protein [Planctomycetes bacterium]|nr:DUF3347 domain-containing protein [Planctomycetota bacterium]